MERKVGITIPLDNGTHLFVNLSHVEDICVTPMNRADQCTVDVCYHRQPRPRRLVVTLTPYQMRELLEEAFLSWPPLPS
jgi:phosphopantetheinyl transferase